MNTSNPRLLSVFVAPLLAFALAPLAVAQQQVNTGGALDANTRVGSGGVVPAGQVPDFRARNLLITGQVTDGRQFRGDVGYSAAGSFGGSLGSDDLFRFRADSFGSSGAATGFGNALNSRTFRSGDADLAGGNVIYNNFFTPGTVNNVGPSPLRTVVSPDGSRSSLLSSSNRFTSPESFGLDTLVGDSAREGQRGSLGLVRDEQGRALQLNASPVFGVTRSAIEGGYGDIDSDQRDSFITGRQGERAGATGDASQRNPMGDLAPGSSPNAGADPAADPFAATDRNADPTAARDTRVTGQRRTDGNPALASNPGMNPGVGRDPLTGLPVAVQLGARLAPGVNPLGNLNADAAAAEDQRVTRLGEAIFRRLDSTAAAAGDDAYLDLLRDIRADFTDEKNPDAQPGHVPPQGPAAPKWMGKLDDNTDDDLIRKAEENRLTAIASMLRAQRDNAIAQGRSPDDKPTPEEAAVTDAMRSVIDQLSYDLPRLETLQGQRKTRVNTNFGLAETALAQGKFFNAVSLYRQLTLDAPGNPLARVGQVHAQMGAGMIRSAALHLRTLFESHPELIATRYAENLLPPEDRFVWLRNELQRLIEDPQAHNADAGLMLAYLGHQIESRQLVRYGLAVSQQAAPMDPLVPLLRKVWLHEKD